MGKGKTVGWKEVREQVGNDRWIHVEGLIGRCLRQGEKDGDSNQGWR